MKGLRPVKEWSMSGAKKPEWPLDESGARVAPAFLEHLSGSKIDMDMELGMLSAYGIPAVCTYPNDGEFSEIIAGYPVCGADVFVPETLLEDARNILSCDLGAEDAQEEEK